MPATISIEHLTSIASRIGEQPLLSVNDPGFQAVGERIARLCESYDNFVALDEKPGALNGVYGRHYGGWEGSEWHIKLRRARNDCEQFFAILGGA